MKDLRVKIERKTSMVYPDKDILGLNYENLQGNIIFYFDEFVDGIGWLEIKMPDGTKGYLVMEKVDETYILPIKSSLLAQLGDVYMQLRVTQDENVEGIPVFKSNIFYVTVKESINATATIPDEYPEWIDIANAKILEMDEALAEVDRLDIDATKVGKVATVSITNKEGTTKSVNISDGEDAKINGVNTITIEAGTNIGLEQEGSTLTIENTYDDSDKGATIEATINTSTYVMTVNLKNSAGTVISTTTVDLPLESVVVSGRYDSTTKTIILTLQNGNTIDIPVGDLVAGLQSEITSDNKLSSDLVDDTNHTNKFVTASEKATWNNKSDFSGDYNDLTNKPDLSAKLDKEDAITMFSNAVVEEVSPSKEIEINSVYGYFGKKLDQDELVYDLELLGESTQNGTPTPSAPIEIESITSPATITSTSGTETNTVTIPLLHPMRSIGTTRDRIYWNNGKWYDEQKTERVVLNGTEENIARDVSTVNNKNRFMIGGVSNVVKNSSADTVSNILCNRLVGGSINETYNEIQSISYGRDSTDYYKDFVIYTDETNQMTVAEFKTWLSNHNLEVVYELATPVITEITDTATIEALESIRTYTGLTEITSDIDITGSYVKDINEAIPTKLSELTNDSGYVKDTDYATSSKGGTFKTYADYGLSVNTSNGYLFAKDYTYANYLSQLSNYGFIGKATLENVITGKGLVKNTDYANENVGGVVKTSNARAFNANSSGSAYAGAKTYTEYTNSDNYTFIGKGTLENVITGKELLSTSDVKNNVVSTDTNKPLSANMGKELNDRIQNLASIGKYLAMWDCTTGLPTTNPVTMPYSYTTGDYYVISNVGATNYMPNGSSYSGTASSTQYSGTEQLAVGDFFYYDGTVWSMLKNTGKTVYFANIAGNPTDNSNLASALAGKVNTTDYATSQNAGIVKSGSGFLVNSSGVPSASNWSYSTYVGNSASVFIGKGTLEAVFAGKKFAPMQTLTQAEYDALVSGGTVDENTYYFIEEE